jgi:hypothetical protein
VHSRLAAREKGSHDTFAAQIPDRTDVSLLAAASVAAVAVEPDEYASNPRDCKPVDKSTAPRAIALRFGFAAELAQFAKILLNLARNVLR